MATMIRAIIRSRLRHLPLSVSRRRSFVIANAQLEQSTESEPLDVENLLSKPSWSVSSLLPSKDSPSSGTEAPVSSKQLHHLLRLSALPPPATPDEEQKMLQTLSSQLHFVRSIKSVDTTGVEALRSLRDETAGGKKEAELGLEEMREALVKEEVRGKWHRRVRRRSEDGDERRPEVEGGWDVLGHAERKTGSDARLWANQAHSDDAKRNAHDLGGSFWKLQASLCHQVWYTVPLLPVVDYPPTTPTSRSGREVDKASRNASSTVKHTYPTIAGTEGYFKAGVALHLRKKPNQASTKTYKVVSHLPTSNIKTSSPDLVTATSVKPVRNSLVISCPITHASTEHLRTQPARDKTSTSITSSDVSATHLNSTTSLQTPKAMGKEVSIAMTAEDGYVADDWVDAGAMLKGKELEEEQWVII